MPHPLTPNEASALHFHALALRPDWANNNPGGTWKQTLGDYTLPHAVNYPHALDALTEYATAQKNGQPVKRTPNLYPAEGTHWTTTRPNPAVGQPPETCPDHIGEHAHNCRCCRADIKLGQRPPEFLGRRFDVASGDAQSSGTVDGTNRTGPSASEEGVEG